MVGRADRGRRAGVCIDAGRPDILFYRDRAGSRLEAHLALLEAILAPLDVEGEREAPRRAAGRRGGTGAAWSTFRLAGSALP